MIQRSVKIQLLVFIVLSAAGIVYAGANYVGVGKLLFNKPFDVTVHMADSGGIFTNAEVTDRGVTVGKVGALKLVPDGVDMTLEIDNGKQIPADVQVVVANLSAVGEQYVDIQPQRAGSPYLHGGSEVPKDRVTTPIRPDTLLLNLDQLVSSVNDKNLATVISELDDAFSGTGPALGRLITASDSFNRAMQADLPTARKLIQDGTVALQTQREVRSDLRSFAADLASLSGQIRASDPDLRGVLDHGVQSSKELQALLQDNRQALPLLLGNLVTLSEIQAAPARLRGLQTLLTVYPSNVFNGFKVAPGDGMAHFGMVTDSGGPVCSNTNGGQYVPTQQQTDRTNSATGRSLQPDGQPVTNKQHTTAPVLSGNAKTNAYCLQPHDSVTDVRGSRNVPRPPGDNTYQPYPGLQARSDVSTNPPIQTTPRPNEYRLQSSSLGSTPSRSDSGTSASTAAYDPVTGLLVTPDGSSMVLGSTGGQESVLGADSWKWLLLSGLSD